MTEVLIDTHAHLYLEQFDKDRDEMMARAKVAGVAQMLLPNIDVGTITAMHRLEENHPNQCQAMMGLHPCSVAKDFEVALQRIESHLNRRHYVAMGEIGLDYYWDQSFVTQQKEAFKIQTIWAHERGIPIVIHSRDSLNDLLDLLEDLALPSLTGVFHCFTGNKTQAQRIMDLSFFMGIGGVLTFKNSGVDQIVRDLPMEYLLLETDAPYLTPHPFRGKRNESSYVTLVAEKLAEVKELSYAEVAEITTRNAKNLFHL